MTITLKSISLLTLLFSLLLGCSSSEGKKSSYIIARDPTWYPLQLMGKEASMLGFTDDLCFAIAQNQGFRVNFFNISHASLLPQLDRSSYDGVISAHIPAVGRRTNYVVSDTIYRVGPVLMVHVDSDATSLQQLQNQIIGVPVGMSVVFNINDYPDLFFQPYENILFALDNLSNKQIDGVIMGAVPAYIYEQSFYRGKVKVVTSPLNSLALRLIASNDPEGAAFVYHFNEGLEYLIANGTYDALLKKWGLPNTEVDLPQEPPSTLPISLE